MKTLGSPAALQSRRQVAVTRVAEGYPVEEVANFLDVDPRSMRRWLATSR